MTIASQDSWQLIILRLSSKFFSCQALADLLDQQSVQLDSSKETLIKQVLLTVGVLCLVANANKIQSLQLE